MAKAAVATGRAAAAVAATTTPVAAVVLAVAAVVLAVAAVAAVVLAVGSGGSGDGWHSEEEPAHKKAWEARAHEYEGSNGVRDAWA